MFKLTSYAACKSSTGFVFDTATSLTLPAGRSFADMASPILCLTDATFDAMSTWVSESEEAADDMATDDDDDDVRNVGG